MVQPVLTFVEKHLRSEDWHYRDAAVSAFGAIVEGPEDKMLDPIVKQALPILIAMMSDPVLQVKDSAAYALGRITESLPESIDPNTHLTPLIAALFTGLASNPRMASSCCWALMNLADRFAGEPGAQTNPLSPHFQASVMHLLQVTERQVCPCSFDLLSLINLVAPMLIASCERRRTRCSIPSCRTPLTIACPWWLVFPKSS